MTHTNILSLFSSSVDSVVSSISNFSVNPERDFSRNRKLPPDKLIQFLVAEGSSSTKNELIDFFGLSDIAPTSSAFIQQRQKLLPEALHQVLLDFNNSVHSSFNDKPYRFIAADGSTATFFSKAKFSSDEYFVGSGHSAKGFYSIHINAFYDLETHMYTDALFQPLHNKDEFKAFCAIVDRHPVSSACKNVYIGDRGYCSYNNMAHVINADQFFLFRTKDIHQKGLVGKFLFPGNDTFDVTVDVTLVRSNSSKIVCTTTYKRFVDAATSFDFIEYGSKNTYQLTFRVIRFKLSDGKYECLVTNLPSDEFDSERLKELYNSRWGIESSFRKLKYTIGLSNFHSYKPELIQQEIWGRLLLYNITEALINATILTNKKRKHSYKVNFTVAAHICRLFLRLHAEESLIYAIDALKRELIPIRDGRKYNRLQTAHFRKPRYFIYRAS